MGSLAEDAVFPIRTIAVIGAGPAGVAMTK